VERHGPKVRLISEGGQTSQISIHGLLRPLLETAPAIFSSTEAVVLRPDGISDFDALHRAAAITMSSSTPSM
jgi:hypothetical protein